jgi:hypothetical protein
MKGTDILATIPASGNPLPAILQAFKAGYIVDPVFAPVTLTGGGHTVQVWVATDALRLGAPGDSFRPMVSAMLEQIMADALGLYLPTAKVMRAAYQDRKVAVEPKTQEADPALRPGKGLSPDMKDKGAMIRHNEDVDKGAGAAPFAYVPSESRLENQGKNWINDKLLKVNGGSAASGMAVNHGWYTNSAPSVDAKGIHLWQDRGHSAHNSGTDVVSNPGHYDYSQVAGDLVYPWILVDGKDWMDWSAGLKDPSIAQALNDDGALATSRPYVVGVAAPLPTLPHPPAPQSSVITTVSAIALVTFALFGAVIVAGALQARYHF